MLNIIENKKFKITTAISIVIALFIAFFSFGGAGKVFAQPSTHWMNETDLPTYYEWVEDNLGWERLNNEGGSSNYYHVDDMSYPYNAMKVMRINLADFETDELRFSINIPAFRERFGGSHLTAYEFIEVWAFDKSIASNQSKLMINYKDSTGQSQSVEISAMVHTSDYSYAYDKLDFQILRKVDIDIPEPGEPGTEYDDVDSLPVVKDVKGSHNGYDIFISKFLDAKMTVDGRDVIINIIGKDKVYTLKKTFSIATNMDIFKSGDVYYKTIANEPTLIINRDETKGKLYESGALEKAREFIPHSFYNLKTDELKDIKQLRTYTYLDKDQFHNYYAYFYTDQVVIDNLLNISGKFSYQKDYNFLYGGKDDTIHNMAFSRYAEKTTEINGLNWENAGYAALQFMRSPFSAIKNGFLTDPSAYAFGPGYEMAANGWDLNGGTIPEIEKVKGSGRKDYIVKALSKEHGVELGDDKNMFKVFINSFKESGLKGIDLVGTEGIIVTNLTYETDGIVYEIDEDLINNVTGGGDNWESPEPIIPPLPDDNILKRIGTWILKNPTKALLIGLIIIILPTILPLIMSLLTLLINILMIPIKIINSAFKKRKKK